MKPFFCTCYFEIVVFRESLPKFLHSFLFSYRFRTRNGCWFLNKDKAIQVGVVQVIHVVNYEEKFKGVNEF